MLYNINILYLQCVFHGIRFKVNEDWLSGDNHFFIFSQKVWFQQIFLLRKSHFYIFNVFQRLFYVNFFTPIS